MAKIDLDSLSIEELVALRENAAVKLAEKVAAKQADLEAELAKLSQYGKPAKKSAGAAPAAKVRKSDAKKIDVPDQPKIDVPDQPRSDVPDQPIADAA
jgi:hypothetical protein